MDPSAEPSLDQRLEALIREQGLSPEAALLRMLGHGGEVPQAAAPLGRVGPYRIVRLVGMGGMGATYEALTPGGETVAIKLSGGLTAERRARFQREAAVLKSLDHPGVVRYRDHGIAEDGTAYLVMDLVAGVSLQEVLDEVLVAQPASPAARALLEGIDTRGPGVLHEPAYRRRVLRLLHAVAEALGAAHRAGIVHRDVKPANVLVRDDLAPVLIDFGLARDTLASASLTRSLDVVGTLAYMPPEQGSTSPAAVQASADVYAVGRILLRALAGPEAIADGWRPAATPPNTAESAPARRALSPAERALAWHCLSPDPRERYPDANALASELASLLATGRTQRRVPSPWRSRLRPLRRMHVAVGAGLLAVATAGWMVSTPGTPEAASRLCADAVFDTGLLRIAGVGEFSTPLHHLPLAPGTYDWTYEGRAVAPSRGRVHVPAGARPTRLNIVNRSTLERESLAIDRRLAPAVDAPLLRVEAGHSGSELWLDGVRLDPATRWLALPPGAHEVVAVAPGGGREAVRLDLQPTQLQALYLVSHEFALVPAKHRVTLGHVLQPLPAGVSLTLGDGAGVFVNDFRDAHMAAAGCLAMRCCLTALEPGRPAHATLRIEFPETVHALAAHWGRIEERPGGTLEVHWRVQAGDWQPEPAPAKYGMHPTRLPLPPEGTRWLEVRASMTCAKAPRGAPAVEFLPGYADVVPFRGACLGVIADPDPDGIPLPR